MKRIVTRWSFWLAVLLVAAGCVAAYGFGRSRNTSPTEGLFVAAPSLDFGEVWEQHDFKWTLVIENRRQEDVPIVGFAPALAITDINPTILTIAAGGRAEVRLTLDLTSPPLSRRAGFRMREGSGTRFENSAQERVALFEAPIRPRILGAPPNDLAWALRGRVRRILTFTPALVDFDAAVTQGESPPSRTVKLTHLVPLGNLKCRCDPSLASAELSERGTRLDIRAATNLPGGEFAFDVMVEGTTAGGEKLPVLRLPVTGRLLRDVRTIPLVLNFGPGLIGESLSETVVLQAKSGNPFVIEQVRSTSPDLTAERPPNTPCAEARVLITQRVSAEGTQKRRIDFTVRSIGKEAETVSLAVSHYGRSVPKTD